MLLCLGLDYRRGGFVDRAVAAFTDVLKLDPQNEAALVNLEKLQEDQHQWQEAYVTRQRLAQIAGPPDQPKSQSILAFLENELGLQAIKDNHLDDAARRFEAAIDLDRSVVPAYLHLGDVKLKRGDMPGAMAIWERSIDVSPDRAYLALDRLERAYDSLGASHRFPDLCRKLTAAAPREWRARVALARHLTGLGQPSRSLELLFDALEHNPHALAIHQAIWNTLSLLDLPKLLVARYIEITRESVFYLDPHVCMRCRYRSTELLLAVPALPRVEHVRRGAHHPGDRHRGGDSGEPRADLVNHRLRPRRGLRRGRPDRSGSRSLAASRPGSRTVSIDSSRSARRRSTPTCSPARPWRQAVAASTPSSLASAPPFAVPTARSTARRSRSIVFADAAARRDLEAIVHPIVYAAIRDWFERAGAARRPRRSVAIADVPLLYETGHESDFDRVVVAYCRPEQQLARLMARNRLSEADARARIDEPDADRREGRARRLRHRHVALVRRHERAD